MLSLLEIEAAAEALPPEQQRELFLHLGARLGGRTQSPSDGAANGNVRHSVLDIPPVSVGHVLRTFSGDDDLLEEMLEGRRL